MEAEWHSRPDMLDRLAALIGSMRVTVDVLAQTVEVGLDADDIVWSGVRTTGYAHHPQRHGPQSKDGPPIFSTTLADLQAAVRLACDPDPEGEPAGEDADGDPKNDCAVGRLAAGFGMSVACPIQGNCNLLGDAADAIAGVSSYASRLRLTLQSADVEWIRVCTEYGGWIPGTTSRPCLAFSPALHVRYRAAIDFAPSGDLATAVDWGVVRLNLTWFEASLVLPLRAGEDRCAAGCSTTAPTTPSVTWTDFTPDLPGDTTWGTRNLVLGGGSPEMGWIVEWDWSASFSEELVAVGCFLEPSMHPCCAEPSNRDIFRCVDRTIRRARSDALVGLSSLASGLNTFLESYLNFLLPAGSEPITSFAVKLLFDVMEENPAVEDALLRLLEGSAGASRYWWNMFTEPAALADAVTGTSYFEFSDVTMEEEVWPGRVRFEVQSDTDCDGLADHQDPCPTACTLSSEPDRDGDGLGDSCDLCQFAARPDDGLPRSSPEYIETPGLYVPRAGDTDGDEVGDRCDLCPTMRWFDYAVPYDPLTRETEGPAALDWEGAPPADYLWSAHDGDGDGIGNRCDNCPAAANRDQWNCNADWERVYPSSAPFLLDPPTPFRVGIGDACDADFPCVDSCVAPEREPTVQVERMEGDERYWTPPHRPTASVDICPTWWNRAGGGSSATLGPPVDTLVQRCHCSQAERADGTCERDYCPLNVPENTGRWEDADYDGAPRDASGEILPTPYQYRELYYGDPDLGLLGPRGSILGYAAYWGAGRSTRQEWNWRQDLCEYAPLSPCRYDARMWFRPEPTAGTAFFGRTYDRAYGNTYTRWVRLDGEGIRNSLPPGTMYPPFWAGGGGMTGITIPWVVDDTGRIGSNTNVLIDILRVRCFAEWGPCPRWPEWLFFQTAGEQVAGLAVSSWNASSNDIGWTLGTRLASTAVFDLTDPAVGFAFDAKGDPYRFWSFGGSDASGRAADQMWVGALTVRDAWGFEHLVDAAGLPVEMSTDGRPDPERTFFSLSPVPRGNLWPPARRGAVLVCTGAGSSVASGCDGQCPRPAVALGLEPPPDGDREPTGSLLLVGGEGDDGPLSDIWLYDERATWVPPSDVAPGDGEPWVSGWRRVGELPDVAGGLTDAGATRVGRTLWLVGGRTAAGPTSDLFRIDLDTGAARRIAGSGIPSGRVAPAVAYDAARARLVVFGGSDASNRAIADLWYVDPRTGRWSLAAAPCAGDGCPSAAGRAALSVSRLAGEVTVVADRGLSTPATSAWTLRSGVWESLGERRGDLAVADCDGDGAAEALHGARCAIGSTAGFPDFGRLRCSGGRLSCRVPVAPAVVASERTMRDLAAVATEGEEVFALRGAQVEVFRIGPTGEIVPARTLRLRAAAHDLAAAPGVLLAAHGSGVSLYNVTRGSLLATIDTCGKPRRVFAEGRRAYIVGLLSLVVADISDPAAPVVLDRFRWLPGRDGLVVRSCSDCGWFDRGMDRVCDALGGCGAFGRGTAAYDRGLLFLHLFGVLHVLDVRDASGAALLASVPVGPASELRVEGDFIYLRRPFREGLVVRRGRSGEWTVAGPHDVWRWVDAALDVGPWTVHWEPGRIQVATRQ